MSDVLQISQGEFVSLRNMPLGKVLSKYLHVSTFDFLYVFFVGLMLKKHMFEPPTLNECRQKRKRQRPKTTLFL